MTTLILTIVGNIRLGDKIVASPHITQEVNPLGEDILRELVASHQYSLGRYKSQVCISPKIMITISSCT